MTEVEWKTLPSGYRARVDNQMSEAWDGHPVRIDAEGRLFGGGEMKFYEHEEVLSAMSRECQEAIWVLHIEGEEPGDIRAAYSYRGVTYTEKMPPWVPPPPNMKRLPSIDEDFWLPDHDPPSLKEGLQIALQHLEHSGSCPATTGSEAGCDCHVKKVREAMEQVPL
jgi:hypothetical protein